METLQRTANRGSISTGYDIDNSLKFEADNSEYIARTPSSAGNRETWTLSFWIKRTELADGSNSNRVFEAWDGSTGTSGLFTSTDTFILDLNAGSNYFTSTKVFRDTAAWYHFVIRVDTTSGTASERARVYVNGSELAGSWNSNIGQNTDLTWNQDVAHNFARFHNNDGFVNAYYAEIINVDGTSLAPTEFGETDSDTGIWKPINASPTYGTNGFKLEFKTSGSLGADTSGNSNTWTLNNIAAADQATDTPTNNFCTYSPLWLYHYNLTISEGGQKVFANASNWQGAKGSVGLQNGRWYWEVKIPDANNAGFTGIQTQGESNIGSGNAQSNNSTYCRKGDGGDIFYYGGSESTSTHGGGNMSNDNIIGVFLDLESSTKTLRWFKNGSSYGSTIGLAAQSTSFTTREVFPFYANITSGNGAYFNFGGYSSYTISSGNADANGYGNFEYSPNDGTYNYYSICTKNLAEFG